MPTRCVTCLVLIGACGRSGGNGASAREAQFQVDWPAPCRVPIASEIPGLVKGTFAATIETARHDHGMRLTYAYNGFDAGPDSTLTQEQQLDVKRLVPELPTLRFVVSDRGEVIETDLEDSVRRYRHLGHDPAVILAAAERRPELRELLGSDMRDYWATWAGSWIDWSVTPGDSRELTRTETFAGRSIAVEETLEHLGVEDGLVRLRRTIRRDFPVMAAAGIVVLEAAGKPSVPMDQLTGTDVQVMEVLTDPADLRPRWARSSRRADFAIGGQGREAGLEEINTFDWANATGCGR